MKRLIFAALCCALLTGCLKQPLEELFSSGSSTGSTTGPSTGASTGPAQFDREQAQHQLRPGKNTIKGSAHLQKADGGVATCAGQPAILIPFTAYARERVTELYGSADGGLLRIGPKGRPEREISTPNDPDYDAATRRATADAQGDFAFTNLADGTYYVIARVAWVADDRLQGGALARKVQVSGGEAKTVVLTHP